MVRVVPMELDSARTGCGRADRVLTDATLRLPGSAAPVRGSVALRGDRIIHAGPGPAPDACRGAQTEILELHGKTVMPGFIDSHIHPLVGSFGQMECSLAGLTTREAYLARIAEYAEKHPTLPVVRGSGWQHGCFTAAGPVRTDLDRVTPDRPAFFTSLDGHSAWVNTQVLRAAGIGRATPDPAGGVIERDPESGEPTGTLREWPAMRLAGIPWLAVPGGDARDCARRFFQRAARVGLTTVHEALATPELLRLYQSLEADGELTLRISAALECQPGQGAGEVERLIELRRAFSGRLFQPRAVKFFLDGVVEAHSAYLLEPYADRPGWRGYLQWDPDEFTRTAIALDQAGFQLEMHVIGDGAVRVALDALAAVRRANGARDTRHRLAHLDLVADEDLPRLKELGVVAVVQPAWFCVEKIFFDSTLPFLGMERAHRMYRMRSLLSAGAPVACSSDWPFGGDNSSFNPLEAVTVGMTRSSLDGLFQKPYQPEQAADLASLLDGYGPVGAYANFLERETGILAPGKKADIVVLDRNLFDLPPGDTHTAKVLMTLFEGETVYRDPGL